MVHNTRRFKKIALFRVTSWLCLLQHVLLQYRLSQTIFNVSVENFLDLSAQTSEPRDLELAVDTDRT
eukprot:SAG31_NODE_16877_length_692_cov_0.784148_1_plen_67_part_00